MIKRSVKLRHQSSAVNLREGTLASTRLPRPLVLNPQARHVESSLKD